MLALGKEKKYAESSKNHWVRSRVGRESAASWETLLASSMCGHVTFSWSTSPWTRNTAVKVFTITVCAELHVSMCTCDLVAVVTIKKSMYLWCFTLILCSVRIHYYCFSCSTVLSVLDNGGIIQNTFHNVFCSIAAWHLTGDDFWTRHGDLHRSVCWPAVSSLMRLFYINEVQARFWKYWCFVQYSPVLTRHFAERSATVWD